jgi:aldehyde dehydrogenase (NAD+)
MNDATPQRTSPPITRHLIDGRWTAPTGAGRVQLSNPATGEPSGWLAVGSAGDVDAAVKSATRAFEHGWRDTALADRIEVLERLVRVISTRREDFAQLISREIGAPIDFARAQQVDTAVRHIEATVEAARSLSPTVASPTYPADVVVYEPIGVAALITPWNWPLNQVVLKVAGALAAGCTIVLKPSELSFRTAILFAECLQDVGIPDGVFNVVVGDGTTGAALSAHPSIGAVSFTGSTATGRAVASSAIATMARLTLELGGKSPNLLFADCDLPTAIRQGVAHAFRNAGQSCNAASRMLIDRAIYDQAVALVVQAADATRVDRPDLPGAHIGPLVSQQQFDRVQAYIAQGVKSGARLIAGGPGSPASHPAGYYCRPTVFADVSPDMAIFQDEIFGPVLTLTPFDTEEEAIALANATRYGLAAFIQTRAPDRALRVAKRLHAGMVQINGASRAPGAPFGGVKQSGVGREAGVWGIRAFQEIKSISGIDQRHRPAVGLTA